MTGCTALPAAHKILGVGLGGQWNGKNPKNPTVRLYATLHVNALVPCDNFESYQPGILPLNWREGKSTVSFEAGMGKNVNSNRDTSVIVGDVRRFYIRVLPSTARGCLIMITKGSRTSALATRTQMHRKCILANGHLASGLLLEIPCLQNRYWAA